MRFLVAFTALSAAGAVAIPTQLDNRQTYVACSGLYGTSQCCATDVLGLADLDCGNPPTVPTSADNFSAICAAIGQRARCCVLPILGQDVLCETPTGVVDTK
ncbi:hypothetical protein NKR23_g6919 [Pleurostoma richardsiae]|uniref:Cerato-ulmin n=1 Tax=Pleurostoma richardsiae TaxID=41990 RepID=A0AA38RXV3_9PEZI|nr:hypothetical protein NKR23_g6919 [Pleurostoma richardsiae]